ncbi:PREDICTED: mRNA-decapping enzyme 1B [Dipodomys ordii]|uniref:5'-(N(7)-methylguanosine 5'-triphospho)-[mRNA] hydrolase n=1 Tax=Dipodomys ordii TaxID=10020 RepID=A0A1S3FR86_DIPOR|nr:PREDICTED: mRNA-decapping enzyme 1B [Dipodomys ordii]
MRGWGIARTDGCVSVFQEKTDVEGTLFVYTRSASPKYGFTIMNRLSMENRTEPITKDLDLQLQDPFLLYRNARLSIYGIWFYDKEECQRIAELMKNLTQSEQLRAGAGIPPIMLSAGEGQEADILRMLTKARDEYTKGGPRGALPREEHAKCQTCSEPKQIASSSAIHDNPNLIKPIPVKPGDGHPQSGPQCSQASDSEPQHLSLTTLFGKPGGAPCPRATESPQLQTTPPGRQGTPVARLCPAIQKLMVGSTELRPLAELREGHPCGAHPVGDLAPRPVPPGSPRHTHRTSRPQSLLETLQGAPDPSTPTLPSPAAQLPLPPPPRGPREGSPAPQPGSPGALPPRELLRKLQAVQQQQELQVGPRPALAARFPVVAQSSGTGTPWKKPAALMQATSPQHITAGAAHALLMSPTASTQAPASDREGCQEAPGLLLPLRIPERPSLGAPGPLSRPQLQEALLYLVQNDDSFLNMIYEAYLFSMAQAALRGPT